MSSQHEANGESSSVEQDMFDGCIRVLDRDGQVVPNADVPELTDDELLEMYTDIKLARRFDERAISLQRQGRMTAYAPMVGQEGSQVATSHALDKRDLLYVTYREHAAKYVHGMELSSVLSPLFGHSEGYAIPENVNVMPEYIPIATQIPHAVGTAWGFQLQGDERRAVFCHLGDGATSEGDFHVGLNFAGVFDLPVILFCNNNQWAISVPRERQTASATIAQKAHAYGIDGVRVDGMDPLAVYQVACDALQKAKTPVSDEGRSTLIEAVQYRYGAHTTSDDPAVYRDEDEVEQLRELGPLVRLEKFLYRAGILDDEGKAEIEEIVEVEIEDAIEEAETIESHPPDIFEHVYDEIPDRLRAQLADLEKYREKYGDEKLQGSYD